MNLSHSFKTVKNVITANSPVLLVGTAIAGIVTTGILAAKGGYKARGIVDEIEEERGEELTLQEKAQATWLCYAAPALTGAGAVAATVGVHTIHSKRFTAMAGLYAVTSGKLDDYQEKAEELLGSKKTQQVQDSVAQKSIERLGGPNEHEVVILEGGTELCCDEFSGRYFMASLPIIDSAINKVNAQIQEDGHASLNDFYAHVGLSMIPAGEDVGWSGTKLEPRYGNGELTPDGRSCISFWFRSAPKSGYDRS